MGPDHEVVDVHGFNGFSQRVRDFVVQFANRLVRAAEVSKLLQQSHSCPKQFRAQRFLRAAFDAFGILIKELKVLTEVEDVEELFVYPGPEQIWTQSRTATDHLEELGF